MSQKYIIALEIGSSAVKIAAATYDADAPTSPLTVLAIAREEIRGGVRYGRIQNVEDVTSSTMMALRTLSDNPALAGVEITGVYIGAGGRSLATLSGQAALTLPDEREITAEIIARLQDDAVADVPAQREVLDIVPLQYTIDGVRAVRPIGAFGSRVAGKFTIVTIDPVNRRNINRVVNQKLNLNIAGTLVRPLAIANTTLTVDDTNPGCMLVDLGAETTTVSIFHKGKLQYIATIPMGSRNITRDIALGMGITEDRAEDIKLRLGNAMADAASASGREQADIDNYVQARAVEIVANVVAHIGFAGFTAADLRAGIIVTGGGAKLRGICQLLKEQSQLPVRAAQLQQNIRIADPSVEPDSNIDVISLAYSARIPASRPDAEECVTVQQIQTADEEPENEVEEQTEIAETTYADGGYGAPSFNDISSGGGFIDLPDQQNADDPDLLYDDDEAERRRAERAARAAREREKAERDAAKRMKQRNKVSIFAAMRSKLENLIGDETEGSDLADDE